MRDLPDDVAAPLRRARELEAIAATDGTVEHRRQAYQASCVLMLAAVRAGWLKAEIARAVGLDHETIRHRVAAADTRLAGRTPALEVDPPLGPAPTLSDELSRPVDEREWLTRAEAAAHIHRHPFTIRNWRVNGLLPHTRRVRNMYLYLRADLERAAAGDLYHGVGVDYAKLRAQLSEPPTF